jgi:hypothetical protein
MPDYNYTVLLDVRKICEEWCIESVSDLFPGITVDDVKSHPFPKSRPRKSAKDIDRISWAFHNGSKKPIGIDLGCPSFRDTPFDIYEGLHEFSAALIKEDKYIKANASGEEDWIEEFIWKDEQI